MNATDFVGLFESIEVSNGSTKSTLNKSNFMGKENIYFIPQAATTQVVKCDLDDADIGMLQVPPTVLIETSPTRHQAYWLISKPTPIPQAEALSSHLISSIPEADTESSRYTYPLRLPNTINTKWGQASQISIVQSNFKVYETSELETTYASPTQLHPPYASIPTREEVGHGPHELMASLSDKIPTRLLTTYSDSAHDQLAASIDLIQVLLSLSLDIPIVAYLIKNSASNPYRTLRFNNDREVVKLIVRVMRGATTMSIGTALIDKARRVQGSALMRNRSISHAALDYMRANGKFIRTPESPFYIPNQPASRPPIHVDYESTTLKTYINRTFGLNSTEQEYRYTAADTIAYGMSLPTTGVQSFMSYYDEPSNTMLLHTGHAILRIGPSDIDQVQNGSLGVVFNWLEDFVPFMPSSSTPPDFNWIDTLVQHNTNVTNMTHVQLRALLRVWIIFTLMRNAVYSRPLLALLGQPGGGKTTLAKAIGTMLYGGKFSIGVISDVGTFDTAMSNNAVVFFDNVDSKYAWLPDRLAQSLGSTHIDKRRLWTNNEIYRLKRTACLCVTAHDPQFLRPDVAQRLLVVQLRKLHDDPNPALNERISDSAILGRIIRSRNDMWGALIQDIQRVLSTAHPPASEQAIHIRIEDFAAYGFWIARALDMESDFSSALATMAESQHTLVLDEDQLLIDAMARYISISKNADDFKPLAILWNELRFSSTDPILFESRYKTAAVLGRRLWAAQEAISQVLSLEWQDDLKLARKVWRVGAKDE